VRCYIFLILAPFISVLLLPPVSLFHGRNLHATRSVSPRLLEPWTFVGLLTVCSLYIRCKGERSFQVLSPSVSVHCPSFLNQTPTVHNVGQSSWCTQEVRDLYVSWVGIFVVLGSSKKTVINRYLLLWLSVSNRTDSTPRIFTYSQAEIHVFRPGCGYCRFRHYCIW